MTAMLALSHRPVTDVLSKTMLMTRDAFPHSTLQTLGGSLARQSCLRKRRLCRVLVEPFARRAVGLFLQTEDGSHPDQRVIAGTESTHRRSTTIPRACRPLCRAPSVHAQGAQSMLRLGYLPLTRALSGTAHAWALVAGRDPNNSVVDAEGRVHGLDNLYVVDGSVLPLAA
jgi:hypothetical protein